MPPSRGPVERDYTDEELREMAGSIEAAVTVPVNVEIGQEHRVLDLGEIEALLRKSGRIFLQNCGCREDKQNCDARGTYACRSTPRPTTWRGTLPTPLVGWGWRRPSTPCGAATRTDSYTSHTL
jgi:hypothetical protein